jgi:Adenylate and Guanylate cyclase catalytic domain
MEDVSNLARMCPTNPAFVHMTALWGRPETVADMALGMIDVVQETGKRFGETLEVRIGIHSGEVMAGLIGQHRSIYDVWGDTVNTASRLESSGVPNRIQISEQTYQREGRIFLRTARAHRDQRERYYADLLFGQEAQISGRLGRVGYDAALSPKRRAGPVFFESH